MIFLTKCAILVEQNEGSDRHGQNNRQARSNSPLYHRLHAQSRVSPLGARDLCGRRPCLNGDGPIVGVVTAGQPILAVENIEGYLPWDGDERCFALRVRGDSMIGAGILSGDKVIVRPQLTAENGQIVVALLDDSATVKRFRREKGKVWLLPENPAYDPIDGTDCSIIGLVKAVYREY